MLFVVVDDAYLGICSSIGDTVTLGVDGLIKSLENVSEKQLFDATDDEDGDIFGSGVSGVFNESFACTFDIEFAPDSSINDRPTELKLNSNKVVVRSFELVRTFLGLRFIKIGVSGIGIFPVDVGCSKMVFNFEMPLFRQSSDTELDAQSYFWPPVMVAVDSETVADEWLANDCVSINDVVAAAVVV